MIATVYLLRPRDSAARQWCELHLGSDAQRLGDGYAVEWRYLQQILDAIREDGLEENFEVVS